METRLNRGCQVSNLYSQASKLDVCSMRGQSISSTLKNYNKSVFRVPTKPLHLVLVRDPGSVGLLGDFPMSRVSDGSCQSFKSSLTS